MFKTLYSERVRYFTDPGSPIKIVYGSSLDKNGNIIVKEKGRENLADYIDSFAESCDLSVILNRFLHGDTEALNQKKALFMDLTEMPTNYNDMVNQFNNARELFNGLPTDVKEKFDNDINKFYCTVGTEDWFKKLEIKNGNTVPIMDNGNGNIAIDNTVKEVIESE